MITLALLAVMAAATTQEAAQAFPPPPSVRDSPERLAALRDVLDLGLVDYGSARFRDVRVVHRPSNGYVTLAACGLVNARNVSGGYIGWTRFTVLNDRVELDDGPTFRRGWQVWCDGSDVQVIDPDVTTLVTAATVESE